MFSDDHERINHLFPGRNHLVAPGNGLTRADALSSIAPTGYVPETSRL
jgi:hypothetical protein